MVMTTVITLIMFSILIVYLLATSMNRNITNVYADVNSSFYAAESGLNKRAYELRTKFDGYKVPGGNSPVNFMQSCLTRTGNLGSGDLGCTDYEYRSIDAGKALLQVSPDSITSKVDSIAYVASTYVQDNPKNIAPYPASKVVPAGDLYAGMNMEEYTYQLFSTARKSDAKLDEGGTKVVLQMEFNSRLIPLFQFAAFYNQDLEIRPSPVMTLAGRIHTNSDLYLGSYNRLTLNGSTTAVGNIYVKNKQDNELYGGSGNLVDIVVNDPASPVSILAANSNNTTTNPLLLANLKTNFGNKLLSGTQPLVVPSPGFLGKVDADQRDGIGQYYGKADLRISYQPNNTAMPVAITAIKTGLGGDSSTCATVDDISFNRNDRNTLLCDTLTEQQIQSLRQPVMLRSNISNETRAFCPATLPALPAVTLSNVEKIKVARALQTAIASQSTPIAFSQMNGALSSGVATSFDQNLQLSLLPTSTINTLKGSTYNSIAALVNGCFLAAPIQIYGNHYNGRERRNITLRNYSGLKN